MKWRVLLEVTEADGVAVMHENLGRLPAGSRDLGGHNSLMTAPVLLWFRSDLRFADHAALHVATQAGPVLPVYVLDEDAAGHWAPGPASRWWLHGSLAALQAGLAERGGHVVLARGRAEEQIARLAEAAGAGAVFAGRAVEPWARAQEERVAARLARSGRKLHLARTVSLFEPGQIPLYVGPPVHDLRRLRPRLFRRPEAGPTTRP